MLFIAQIFVAKPGSSGSPRLQFGAIADNGAAVAETLLNVHFQLKSVRVYHIRQKRSCKLRYHYIANGFSALVFPFLTPIRSAA